MQLPRRMWLLPTLTAFGLILGHRRAAALDDQTVIATIGSTSVRAHVIKSALAGVPAFELSALGTTKIEMLRKYVDEAIVREELLAAAALQRGASNDKSVTLLLQKALAGAVLRREMAGVTRESVPESEIKTYYDAHIVEYRLPERVRIWHILLATKEEAEATLKKAKADPTREGWPKLCGEVSVDPNTKRSSGDLGFLTIDGRTTEPKVRAPIEIVKAGFALKDGEIAEAPVKSSAGFHVVWRRSSSPAVTRSLADESANIREVLFEQKRASSYQELIKKLRDANSVTVDDSLLGAVTVAPSPRTGDSTLAPKRTGG